MGVQTLLAIFQDKKDGSCSDASSLFRVVAAFGNEHSGHKRTHGKPLIAKTLTMINPDFALDAFVDKSFIPIRRVCNHITVVGDREDVALQYLSKGGNWIFNRLGFQQPDQLVSRGMTTSERGVYRVLGCDFDRLYFPDGDEQDGLDQDEEGGKPVYHVDETLVFKDVPPLVLSADESIQERK